MQMGVDIKSEKLTTVIETAGYTTPVTDSLRGILKGSYDMETERQLALSKKYATFS